MKTTTLTDEFVAHFATPENRKGPMWRLCRMGHLPTGVDRNDARVVSVLASDDPAPSPFLDLIRERVEDAVNRDVRTRSPDELGVVFGVERRAPEPPIYHIEPPSPADPTDDEMREIARSIEAALFSGNDE